ncbi:TPA: DUF1049 domain-containing protein [Candidatus Galligastranaerophilus intestinigallinarum]|nr:DUF1049 domain-containing protein [Candidatus Galligastranaerophilus intestinigallinarum]
MGTICVILAVLITVFVLMTGQYNDTAINIQIMYTDISLKLSFLIICLLTYALGILAGVLLMLSSFFETASRYSKLKKQYDKTNIGADDAEEKIKVLENKIKTLEIALDKAINNK